MNRWEQNHYVICGNKAEGRSTHNQLSEPPETTLLNYIKGLGEGLYERRTYRPTSTNPTFCLNIQRMFQSQLQIILRQIKNTIDM